MLRAMQPMPETTERQKLEAFVALLLKWNQKINLIGRATESTIWQRHIEDSLQLVDVIPTGTKIITDFGSGGGLPGLVIAIARPDITVNLIESDFRKCAFLKEAARQLEIPNAKIHNARIEVLKPIESDVITARAFAPLDAILAIGGPFAGADCTWLLLKGKSAENEILTAKEGWDFVHTLTKSRIPTTEPKDQGSIVTLTQVRKRA